MMMIHDDDDDDGDDRIGCSARQRVGRGMLTKTKNVAETDSNKRKQNVEPEQKSKAHRLSWDTR